MVARAETASYSEPTRKSGTYEGEEMLTTGRVVAFWAAASLLLLVLATYVMGAASKKNGTSVAALLCSIALTLSVCRTVRV